MKKTLLLGMLLVAGLSANAQIDNVAAPQFSGVDVVTGETVSLQAYLDQGKTVVVYMSAAWCGPCWSFHNTHALTDLYHAFGPQGSDEVVIIYVESDWRTPAGELAGVDLPQTLPPGVAAPAPPQGDWITGTPYHIINEDTVAESYDIPGFPTIFAICPSGTAGQPGTAHEIQRGTPGDLTEFIGEKCTTPVGVDHWARVTADNLRYCDSNVPVIANVEGYGHALTSIEAQLKKNDVIVATQTFTLNLKGFEVGQIEFDGIVAEAGADYTVEILQVNGAAALTTIPANNVTEDFNVFPSASIDSNKNIKITIHTDEYPNEMKLYIITDDANPLIAYQTPTYGNTTANKEKTFEYYVTLEANKCYGVVLQDAVGDGWDYNTPGTPAVEHGVTITSGGVTLFSNAGDFGQQLWQDATLRTNDVLDTKKFDVAGFAIYPNPSNGQLNISTTETVDVTIIDITGKTVHTATGINDGASLNLTSLQSGMYIAKIKGQSGEKIEKLVIK